MLKKTRGIMAAGHTKTAEAGLIILENGGNAFDAVVAAILASLVVEPALTSAAGGGFLLAHTQNQKNILFDFFTQTPRYPKPQPALDFYPIQVNFGDAFQEFHIGLGSIAVPGTLAGAFHVHQRLGRLPWSEVVTPAIEYARTGVEINPFQGFLYQLLEPILLVSAAGQKIYAPHGQLVKTGDVLKMPDLALTLELLAKNGIQPFYQGEIARQIVQDCQQQGGYLTLEDLQAYQVIEREPLKINYRGHQLLMNPPPSSGGALIALSLKLLSQIEFDSVAFGTESHLKLLVEVMRLTNQARRAGYDERLYQENIAEEFLADAAIFAYQQSLQTTMNKLGSTTHISVMDDEGNAASVTASNGEGSGYVIPGTGIMMNNMLGEEDLNPLGFHQWSANVRMSSMMAPTMILQGDKPEIVLGSGGSNRIRTAILQVISNLLDFQMPIEQAVNCSRIHWENQVLNVEPNFLKGAMIKAGFADSEVVLWKQQSLFFGGVHSVMKTAQGEFQGAGDQRRNGAIAKSK